MRSFRKQLISRQKNLPIDLKHWINLFLKDQWNLPLIKVYNKSSKNQKYTQNQKQKLFFSKKPLLKPLEQWVMH